MRVRWLIMRLGNKLMDMRDVAGYEAGVWRLVRTGWMRSGRYASRAGSGIGMQPGAAGSLLVARWARLLLTPAHHSRKLLV